MKIGLVLEGGGMRGFYTAGVLDGLMDCAFEPDYVIGVSAGACNAASFLSGQRGRNLRIFRSYLHDPRYLSMQSLRTTGSMFGMDFVFDEIPNKLDLFDYESFFASPAEFVVGVTDVWTGKPVYFDKDGVDEPNLLLRASSAIPCFSPIVKMRGGRYLDGGTSDPIPVEKALSDGCDRVVVVLTRDRNYRKKPETFRAAYRRAYREYPALVAALDRRHEVYNQTLSRLRILEREGRALVIAPREPMRAGRFEKRFQKLEPYYKDGVVDVMRAWPKIAAMLNGR